LTLGMQMAVYSAMILEHAKYPRKFGRIAHPDRRFEEVNPLCGDRIRVELRLAGNGAVEEVRFSGEMCAIAKASASILFASLEGMIPAALTDLNDEQILRNLDGSIKSTRVKCALLPVIAFRGAMQSGDGNVRLS
jgi:nitrogen fixation protein NifU and related proteins